MTDSKHVTQKKYFQKNKKIESNQLECSKNQRNGIIEGAEISKSRSLSGCEASKAYLKAEEISGILG